MSQSDYGTIDPATKTGSVLASDLNSQRDAYHSNHKGSSAPSYIASGMIWVDDTTSTDWKLNFYDGTNSVELFSVNSVAHTADYSGGLSGVGNLTMTGNLTLSTNEATINLQDAVGTGVINMDGGGRLEYDASVLHFFHVGGVSKMSISNTNTHVSSTFSTDDVATLGGEISIGQDSTSREIIALSDDFDTDNYHLEFYRGGTGGSGVNLNSSNIGKTSIRSNDSEIAQFSLLGGFTCNLGAVFSSALATSKGADIASATSITIPEGGGTYFDVTGTTQIEALSTTASSFYHVMLQFDSSLTLKHSSSLNLPGSADIVTQAGDVGYFVQESHNVWRLVSWQSTIAGSGAGTGDMVLADVQTITGAKTFDDSKFLLRNVADTFNGVFTNTNSADRTYTLPDVTGTIALTTSTVAKSTNIVGGSGGSIPYQSATDTTALLANGTAGQYLKSNGTTLAPSWETFAGGSGDMVLADTQTNTGAKTFNDTTFLLRNVADSFNGSFVNTNTADRVYTLPDVAGTIALTSTDTKQQETIIVALSDEDTDLTASTTVAKMSYRVPTAFTLSDIKASLTTAGTDATVIMDVHLNGTTIMTTDKLDIESGEFTTDDATTQPVLTTTALSSGDLLEFFVDQIGSTIAGAGAKVYMIGNRT